MKHIKYSDISKTRIKGSKTKKKNGEKTLATKIENQRWCMLLLKAVSLCEIACEQFQYNIL